MTLPGDPAMASARYGLPVRLEVTQATRTDRQFRHRAGVTDWAAMLCEIDALAADTESIGIPFLDTNNTTGLEAMPQWLLSNS